MNAITRYVRRAQLRKSYLDVIGGGNLDPVERLRQHGMLLNEYCTRWDGFCQRMDDTNFKGGADHLDNNLFFAIEVAANVAMNDLDLCKSCERNRLDAAWIDFEECLRLMRERPGQPKSDSLRLNKALRRWLDVVEVLTLTNPR